MTDADLRDPHYTNERPMSAPRGIAFGLFFTAVGWVVIAGVCAVLFAVTH